MCRFYSFHGIILFLSLGFLGIQGLRSQDLPSCLGKEPVALTPDELFVLSRVPLLELPDTYKGPDAPLLPYTIDNSTQPYFRSITWQSGFECGQSAGVAFNFTYEIDRLRNVAANTNDNTYPTHFVWDFLNNGDNYTGASFFDSWEIVRACGTMNVTDYGGQLNTGGYKRWINGYPAYYNGMHNRLTAVKAIRCDNPDGLQTLKYWLFDHLEGSSVGGVANFYAQYYGSVSTTLPPGTPEAGKYVQTSFGGSPSHAWTVVGYNDSIRWDFNGDGLYTNNIDINNDGVVDMHDWEIGGLKFASGYAGTGWCNGGFCYLMYKSLADNIGYGGIWNHTVYIVDVKQTCNPQLTMKVTLQHVCRSRVRVTVGTSTDLTATVPSKVYSFPIFNYQGGPYYMQGGTTEADKTIEFGLDLAPVLADIMPGQQVKYFLQVQETDPGNSFDGAIINAALIDYSGSTPVTTTFPSTNVPLINNDITRISTTYSCYFSRPSITTSSLPMASLYQPYQVQLAASGGSTPYQWDVKLEYPENTNTATMPNVTAQQLTLTNNNSGYAIKTLDFNFPFFKKSINKVWIYADGYILFDDQPYTYPYIVDKQLLFRQTPVIAPFLGDLALYTYLGDGIWYEGDANSATFRWKASISGVPGSSAINMAVKLYPNGTIEMYYGTISYPIGYLWTSGISGGDNKNYQYSMYSGINSLPSNILDKYTTCQYPVEMTVTEDGIFQGTPQSPCQNVPIKFMVTDNNGVTNYRTLNYSVNGLSLDYSVSSGGDSLIENGETANVTVSLTNLGTQPVQNTNITLTTTDPYILVTDGTEYLGTIGAGQTVTATNAFAFQVSPNVPNDHNFMMTFHVTSSSQSFDKEISLMAFAPEIVVGSVEVLDGDNARLDPGETTDLRITFHNFGGARVQAMNVLLNTVDTLVTINTGQGQIPMLLPDSSQALTFNVSASPLAPFEHLYSMKATSTGSGNFTQADSIWVLSGEILEDFETGNFDKFDWNYGFIPWTIDTYEPWEGSYCTRSGWIYDNAESGLYVTVKVLEEGVISFRCRTACQEDPQGTNTDFLAFYIDDAEYGRWDGLTPWVKETFPVTKGNHTFKWVYRKDASGSSYSDCAWLDFITFPPFAGALPHITVSPASLQQTLDPGQSASQPLFVENTGGGTLNYSVMTFDTASGKDLFPKSLATSTLTCDATSFVPGQSYSWNFTVINNGNDGENIRGVRMDIPEGVHVTGSTNFSGGSLGDLLTDGSTGNGPTITWQGENNGQGVIKPGESATASLTGTVEEANSFDVFVVYSIRGDSSGSDPHAAGGQVRIANNGLSNSWISFSPATGTLLPGEKDTITATFHALGLTGEDYQADILVRDPYNNMVVVPAHLHVNQVIGIPAPGSSGSTVFQGCYPNPFSGTVNLRYFLATTSEVSFEIWSASGWLVRNLDPGIQEPGTHTAQWDGADENGTPVPSGVYYCRMRAGTLVANQKLVVIR